MAVIAKSSESQIDGFDSRKSVQSIAYFLRKAGQSQDKMKLIKLLYLAERESIKRRGKLMNFDDTYSMKDGPILSMALDGLNGKLRGWDAISLASNRKTVSLVGDISDDHLSRADITILDDIWQSFGHLSTSQLRAWVHRNCGEHKEIESGRIYIPYSEIMRAVGLENPEERARELRMLQEELGTLPEANAA